MSNCKMSLMVLGVGMATLVYSASARGQGGEFFEACGVLGLTQPPEVCLGFFPDSGEFSRGLGRFSGWENFELGDHIHVAGVLFACGGFCTDEGLCFDADDSVIVVCPTIPTASEWGMIALGLLVLVAGTIVIRTGKRSCSSVGVLGVFFLLALGASSFAQDPLIAQKVNRMLQSPHDPNNMLVRFKAATQQAARDALHTAAGAVKVKAYRFVDGLTLSRYHVGLESSRLVSRLSF